MSKIKWLLIAGAVLGSGLFQAEVGRAEDSGVSLESLDQKLKVIERKLELDAEAAEEKKKTGASVQANPDGIAIKSGDGKFAFRLRGVVQADARFYLDDQRVPLTNTFLLRRVRPIADATLYGDFDAVIVPDFGGGAVVLQDGYLDYHPLPYFKIRAGKFKSPVGLERLQSDPVTRFIEAGLPTALVPNRDVGLQIHGDIAGGYLSYALAIFNGVTDGGSLDVDTNDTKETAARIFALPFKNAYSDWLRDLGIGVGGTYGTFVGALPSYRTTGQATFFSYSANVTADGSRSRISPQLYYYVNRFGLLSEYAVSSQEVRRANILDNVSNESWQVSASILLTNDKASFKGVSPKKPFEPKAGQWGAWEIAGRYGELKIDGDAFSARNSFAAKAASASLAQAWAAGINWYLNKAFKIAANYEETSFQNGASLNRHRETEKIAVTRFQVAF